MIAEFGHFCLALAFALAAAQALVPAAGVFAGQQLWMRSAGTFAAGQFVFVLISLACLVTVFLQDDFSVAYVANNSNTLLPLQYKISAVWGAHEGSFLLWTAIMGAWTMAVAVFSRHLPLDILARVLSVMGALSVGFIAFILWTSNPFDRLLPIAPGQGSDLNPLLQDFGLIVHPPMLYTGYVGLSVAFAFAIAALWSGRLDSAWARWSRPWTNVAWAFLTLGITLGSWWAYYELGWGGWWFWDPVENASFLPWLVATALVHSLAVTEKRGMFKSWTVLLALTAFSLSLLGGFIVRSGVLTSVHAFAVDPERGLFILVFLGLVVGGSLLLYALRAPLMRAENTFEGPSREALLLVNNVLFFVAAGVVLAGTLAPLVYEAVTGGDKISVGRPYFNALFIPLMAMAAVALALSPRAGWKRATVDALLRPAVPMIATAVIAAGLLLWLAMGALKWQTLLAAALALWILLEVGRDAWQRIRSTGRVRQRLSAWGMWIAHAGFAVTLAGVCLTSHYSVERDLRMAVGDSVEVGGYRVQFNGVREARGPNFLAQEGQLLVTDSSGDSFTLAPQKRRYLAGGNMMTEAAIDGGVLRDVYVALGEPVGDGAWAVRVHVKPAVRWVWFGGLMIALGGVLAVMDARYRRRRRRVVAPAGSAVPGVPAATVDAIA